MEGFRSAGNRAGFGLAWWLCFLCIYKQLSGCSKTPYMLASGHVILRGVVRRRRRIHVTGRILRLRFASRRMTLASRRLARTPRVFEQPVKGFCCFSERRRTSFEGQGRLRLRATQRDACNISFNLGVQSERMVIRFNPLTGELS